MSGPDPRGDYIMRRLITIALCVALVAGFVFARHYDKVSIGTFAVLAGLSAAMEVLRLAWYLRGAP